MVLDRLKNAEDDIMAPIAKKLDYLNPNVITCLSFTLMLAASYFIYLGATALIYAFILLIIGSFLDALDGVVARISGKTSVIGDFLDHSLDRFADLALILGVGFSQYCSLQIAIFALGGVLLASYMGTQAQAVGVGRIYGGVATRADRLIALIVGVILQYFYTEPVIYDLKVLEIVMVYFAVFGIITAIYRFFVVLCRLHRKL